jgi:LacI family transcriptional regulator
VSRLTIRDVAERAGVSVATVSNALNRPEIVAEDTLARVRSAIDEIGFVRNGVARQLRGFRSAAIGLVVLHLDPFFAEVARGVEDAATEVDHLVVLCSSGGDLAREDRHLRLLDEQRVAGVLMTPVRKRASTTFDAVRRRGTPIVLVDRRSRRSDGCSVAVDDVEGGYLAARHLIGLGHSRIGLINGPRAFTQCVDRRAGFVRALEESGLALGTKHEIEMDSMTMAAGATAANRLLQQPKAPTAFFCANDLLALGAQRASLESGRRIPDDVAIVGYDDVPFARMAFVPLTSIRQPAYDLGHSAARLLLEELSGASHRHEQVMFTPELVVRASTGGAGTVPVRAA